MIGHLYGATEASNVIEWFGDSASRRFSGAIPHNLLITVEHAFAAIALAFILAVPSAMLLAHFRKAEFTANFLASIGRVIPTITILAFAVLVSLRNGFGFTPWPIVTALTFMAIPPLFANTYTAVREVPVQTLDAAQAMGMTQWQVLVTVELPLALPMIFSAVRIAVPQAIATEVLGALFGGGGLGIYLTSGLASSDSAQLLGGVILVAGAALISDSTIGLIAAYATPKGVAMPYSQSGSRAHFINASTPENLLLEENDG